MTLDSNLNVYFFEMNENPGLTYGKKYLIKIKKKIKNF